MTHAISQKPSLPGSTRQSLPHLVDARIKSGHDGNKGARTISQKPSLPGLTRQSLPLLRPITLRHDGNKGEPR